MGEKIKHRTLLLIWIIMGLWISCLVVSIWWHVHEGQGSLTDILFQIMNSLFSGIAIIVSSLSIVHQSKDFDKQIDVNTFMETIRRIVESDKFRESHAYILSELYNKDIDYAKQLLRRNDIYLDDIKNICSKKKRNRLTSTQAIEDLYISCEKILYLCSEIELLGTFYSKGIASDFIIEYYRTLIIETYERLYPILSNPKEIIDNYPYFTKMYNAAKIRELINQSLAQMSKK